MAPLKKPLLALILCASAVLAQKPPKVVLVGDSTVNDEGGWGPGFKASLGPAAEVVNLARNGRSSKSFRDEGAWPPALAAKPAYILIQFGHNDVPGKGADRETDPRTTYRANLARYVDEARSAGARPILITSIVRRNFTPDGKIKVDSLAPYVKAVRSLAAEERVPLIDLYALTLSQAETLGPAGCEQLNARDKDGKPDTTHLSPKGQQEIGALAAREFSRLTGISPAAEVVVAADGSGQYTTVQQAVDAAPSHSRTRFVIRIKPGVYKEHIVVPHVKPHLSFLGEDPKTTVLTDDRFAAMPGPNGQPLGTFGTPSTSIEADDFTAENITFENSAGNKGQAVALAVLGDRAVFRNCRFLGWQDTLLAQTGRQYFKDSYIEGAVDFIFGGSTAYFENCHIHAKGSGYITAAATPKDQPYGYVFSKCRITGESEAVKTDLGRPWRDFAAVVFLDTQMTETVRPAGWNNWQKPERERTSRYSEYRSSNPGTRVPWARQLADAEAKGITLETVLAGADGWNPHTGKVHRTPLPPAIPRDPTLLRGPDGLYHRVRSAEAFLTYANSKDGVHWSSEERANLMAKEDAIDVTSPSLFYDATRKQYVITWASTIRQNFFQSFQEEVENNPRIWFTVTRDFKTFSPSQVLFEPGYSVKDAVIVRDGKRYALVHRDNRRSMQAFRVSYSASPYGPWGPASDTF